MFIKLEKRKITKRSSEGHVLKTEHVCFQWFPLKDNPTDQFVDGDPDCIWYSTSDHFYGQEHDLPKLNNKKVIYQD